MSLKKLQESGRLKLYIKFVKQSQFIFLFFFLLLDCGQYEFFFIAGINIFKVEWPVVDMIYLQHIHSSYVTALRLTE